MLGAAAAHPDERIPLLTAFLRAPADLAAAMLVPLLHVRRPDTGQFEAMPAANLALLPGAIALSRYLALLPKKHMKSTRTIVCLSTS